MSNTLNLNVAKIRLELAELNKKIATGLQHFAEISAVEVGISKRELVLQQDKACLYRYQAEQQKATHTYPVLIVYALVNRPYMADLAKGRSLIQALLNQGLDIYMLDWGYPDDDDEQIGLETYIASYIDNAVDFIREQHALDKINLLGICQGGTLSLCYASLFQQKIANLITTVTPVDFQTEKDLLSHLVRHIDVDLSVDAMGNIPGEFLNWAFLMLKPYRLLGRKYFDVVDIVDDREEIENFMRMEKWIFDSPDQVGQAYREFVKYFYQQNQLVKGELQLGQHIIDLQTLTLPILNIYAEKDHIVPVDAAKALAGCVSCEDYTEVALECGHIGLYVSAANQDKLAPLMAEWLAKRNKD